MPTKQAQQFYDKAVAANKAGKYLEAIEWCNKYIVVDPQNAKVYSRRGYCKAQLKQYLEAMQDYDKAIELDPEYADAYNNRGSCKFELGQYDEAIKDYEKAVELNPKCSEAYLNRGNCKLKKNSHNEAINRLRQGHRAKSGVCRCLQQQRHGQSRIATTRGGHTRL